MEKSKTLLLYSLLVNHSLTYCTHVRVKDSAWQRNPNKISDADHEKKVRPEARDLFLRGLIRQRAFVLEMTTLKEQPYLPSTSIVFDKASPYEGRAEEGKEVARGAD